ncbi:long-chain fatty acid transport protein 2-like [Periophthalmus magnuspinnatus]|uniref:long-chain fatty acid transport protein 2-like n=1 Tax=Periophthalmus magnuspinnatus TaxID=409849 RepID=UPI00145AC8EA|nr:long-chain fatty acid transport protein 2-like [Periophthalmus magnuspinnatus]
MSVNLLYTFLAGLLGLIFQISKKYPYFLHDLRYVISVTGIGIKMAKFQKKTPYYTVLERFLEQAKKQPQKTFLIFEGRSFSYSFADNESNKVARALQTHTDLKEGDTAAVFVGNEPDFVWLWLALAKLGCTAALLNTNIRSKSLLHCFSCCDAKVLVAGADLQGAVEEVLPGLKDGGARVFVLGQESCVDGIETLSDKIQEASDQPLSVQLRANVKGSSPALYIYTSGTTGLPKAAVVSQMKLWSASSFQTIAGVTSDDIIYLYLPLYHGSGFFMGLTGAIDRGLTIVLKRKFSASQFWDDCRKYNITAIQYIGEIMRYLCNSPKKDNDKNHKVRVAMGNGIRLETWEEFLQRFGDIRICECYGSTEGNVSFVNYTGKLGAVGKENFFIKKLSRYYFIRYDTEKDEPVRNSKGFCIEVPRGETGLLVGKIQKESPFEGYAKNQQQTEKKILKDVFVKGDRYYNTGDLLMMDQHGFVYFQDRTGDTFRWKGENVASTEVTDHLLTVDCIEEASVYGVKVPGHEGRIGMAALKLRDNMDFDCKATHQHVKSFLPSYARPRFIRIQTSLDVTGTYKQTKGKLVEEGFDPAIIKEPLFFLDDSKGYIPMTQDIYNSIAEGKLRL